MARRIYLHIGLPKTGTTFLQTAMWRNRSRLRKQGILYPGDARMDHYEAMRQVRTRKPGSAPEDGMWDRFVSEFAAWPDTGLISHEFFSVLTANQIKRAVEDLAPAEVHVVVTVRSYVRQFPAVWQEGLKMHLDSTFEEFMTDVLADRTESAWGWRSQDIEAVLSRWTKAVPAERVRIVTVPPSGSAPDVLWQRWCRSIGLDDTGFDLSFARRNESLGAEQSALLARIKPQLGESLATGRQRHRWVRRYFGHEVLVPQNGRRFLPRPEHRTALLERADGARRAILDGGYEVIGDVGDLLDPGPATETSKGDPPALPDDVTDAELLTVAGRAFDQMICDVRDLTEERDALRREVAGLRARRPRGVVDALRRRVARRRAR